VSLRLHVWSQSMSPHASNCRDAERAGGRAVAFGPIRGEEDRPDRRSISAAESRFASTPMRSAGCSMFWSADDSSSKRLRVWLATGHTDMRRGFGSLALLVRETLTRDPHGGELFFEDAAAI